MSEYVIQIGDEVRDMTEEEIVQRDKDVASWNKIESDELAKKSAKASAESKLKALGLTDAEVSALLG